MNIHQVVENSRHLENLVEEQKNKIQELEKKMDNMNEVIRQFVGGLYCQRTQQGILENFLRKENFGIGSLYARCNSRYMSI
jgi:TolA-binding protein